MEKTTAESTVKNTQIHVPESTAHRNGIWKIIWNRRSVRQFKPDRVPVDLIEFIISAGRMAPSAMNLQPWYFSVAEGEESVSYFSQGVRSGIISGLIHTPLKQIGKTIAAALHFPIAQTFRADKDIIFHGAPVVIFVAADADNLWSELDVGMCVQNMLLAAESVGLNTCPIGLAKYLAYSRAVKKLQLPENHKLLIAVSLGYGREHPEVQPRRDDNVHYIKK